MTVVTTITFDSIRSRFQIHDSEVHRMVENDLIHPPRQHPGSGYARGYRDVDVADIGVIVRLRRIANGPDARTFQLTVDRQRDILDMWRDAGRPDVYVGTADGEPFMWIDAAEVAEWIAAGVTVIAVPTGDVR